MTQHSLGMDSCNELPLCIAVDWGTTNLRAFLMDHTGRICAEKSNHQGMQTLASDEFESVLEALLDEWIHPDVPIYMAGMVGGRGGWQEVPYQLCPIELDTLSEHLRWLPSSLPCDVAIVPGLQGIGVSGHFDVMRGEETQLLGALDWLSEQGLADQDVLCCLPGTHCKWVPLLQGKVMQFSSSFSGELFARLNQESILVKGMPNNQTLHCAGFEKGVATSLQAGGLLHHLFSVRSDYLCGELPAEQVRDYLSGIVIGHDVNDILSAQSSPCLKVLIIGNDTLSERYRLALSLHRISALSLDARDASIRGLKRLACQSLLHAPLPNRTKRGH
jgi:2-dehydro-3-deoxygalactonokinase